MARLRGRRDVLALGAWAAAVAAAGITSVVQRAGGRAGVARAVSIDGLSVDPPVPAARSAIGVSSTPTATAATGDTSAADEVSLVDVLASRATFGPTPTTVEEIRSMGAHAWIDAQLHPEDIDDSEADALLGRLHGLGSTGPSHGLGRDGDELAMDDLRIAALLRAARSRRQLLELMVDLWHDRLAVSEIKAPVRWYLPAYDRSAIRPHALGRYRDLLRAATTSAAMLSYLDTAGSSAPNVNENHARELLELHTVGRASGYTESDVVGAARVLSGWYVDVEHDAVAFDPNRHHDGPATVMGWSTPGRRGSAASNDLLELLDHLAVHPATARRVATTLASRFVGEPPPASLVDRLTSTYLDHDTSIGAVLRELLTSTEIRAASAPLVRRPFDLLAALVRATEAQLDIPNQAQQLLPIDNLSDELPLAAGVVSAAASVTERALAATDSLDGMVAPVTGPLLPRRPLALSLAGVLSSHGQHLFAAPNPAGHPLSGWGSGDALLRRWSLAEAVARDGVVGISIDPVALVPDQMTAGAIVDAMAARACGRPLSGASRDAALHAVGVAAVDQVPDELDRRALLAMVLASPEVQVR